ncbi:hypothetical protein MHB71_13070 [Paenibacillus sp. FSL H7-0940]|uniref:hypothetical protein n=1 Tax=Paenibacillus sp. FSL H7-0940 TaxID=2921443 RepID=UPI0030EBC1D5
MQTIKERYSSELKSLAWRLKYRYNVASNKDLILLYDYNSIESFESHLISKFYVQDIFNLIPTDVGRKIICSIYIEGKSEKENAFESTGGKQIEAKNVKIDATY